MSVSQGLWNFTLDDTSPMFDYSPYANGINATNGWSAFYSVSGFLTSSGESGDGDSFHVTSLPSASVHLQFFGTGISLAGNANCSYNIILDSSQKALGSPPFGTLFEAHDLENSSHNITLVAQASSNDQVLSFDSATISAPVAGNPNVVIIDNMNTSAVTYSGNWSVNNNAHIPNDTQPAPYHKTSDGDASASVNFTGRAIEIKGVSNFGWWQYIVTLDGVVQPPRNASSWWFVPDAVLFFMDGLDESVPHSLKIDNAGNTGMFMSLSTFTAYQFNSSADSAANSTSPAGPSDFSGENSSKLSGGAIAGIVIGSIIGVALIALALFYFNRRRRYQGVRAMTPPDSPYDSTIKAYDPPNDSKSQRYNRSKMDLDGTTPATLSHAQAASFVPSSLSLANQTRASSDALTPMVFGASVFSPVEERARHSTGTHLSSPEMSQNSMGRALPSPPLSAGNVATDHKVPPAPEGQSDTQSESAVDRMVDVLAERIVARLGADAETLRPPPGYDHDGPH